MEKQTAVEWIIREIIRHQMSFYGTSSIPLYIIEQAKQMEKEQILDSWDDGYSCGMYQEGLGIDYYNENYGGQDEK